MFNTSKDEIKIFVLCVLFLITLLCSFIVALIYKYQQKRLTYNKEIEDLKTAHENTLLQAQLEMQEQTFQHIAREIHDNIGQKLTLAKLYLNTLPHFDLIKFSTKIESSLDLISGAISDLSDISRSMNTDLIVNNGFVKVIELEVTKLQKSGIYKVDFIIEGTEVFLDTNKEVVLFRIVQEAVNNIVKHSDASIIIIQLIYNRGYLIMHIEDNGIGFNCNEKKEGSGLINMQKRAAHLKGKTTITSNEKGTIITIKIPVNENSKT